MMLEKHTIHFKNGFSYNTVLIFKAVNTPLKKYFWFFANPFPESSNKHVEIALFPIFLRPSDLLWTIKKHNETAENTKSNDAYKNKW